MWEGAPDYPDKYILLRVCDEEGVTIFYTAPTAIRAAMKWGIEYDQRRELSTLGLLATVGGPINSEARAWYS